MRTLRPPILGWLRWRVVASVAPSFITSTRFMAIPLILVQLQSGSFGVPLYICACGTDLLDGVIARHLHAETALGSKLDVFADFGLVASVATYLISVDLLSPWFFTLILFAFIQFVFIKPPPSSDPLGMHIGTVLFISLGLSLMYPALWFVWWSTFVASGYVIASLILRWTTFLLNVSRMCSSRGASSSL